MFKIICIFLTIPILLTGCASPLINNKKGTTAESEALIIEEPKGEQMDNTFFNEKIDEIKYKIDKHFKGNTTFIVVIKKTVKLAIAQNEQYKKKKDKAISSGMKNGAIIGLLGGVGITIYSVVEYSKSPGSGEGIGLLSILAIPEMLVIGALSGMAINYFVGGEDVDKYKIEELRKIIQEYNILTVCGEHK